MKTADLEKQRRAVSRLEKRVEARRGKAGVGVHIGYLRQAKHALLRMVLAAAREHSRD